MLAEVAFSANACIASLSVEVESRVCATSDATAINTAAPIALNGSSRSHVLIDNSVNHAIRVVAYEHRAIGRHGQAERTSTKSPAVGAEADAAVRHQGSLRLDATVERVVRNHGAIDVLINDAGVIQVGPIDLVDAWRPGDPELITPLRG
jgi:NAD(P)-dependent dehydrogenase (short-subunit alcohol dehydrogenase family)